MLKRTLRFYLEQEPAGDEWREALEAYDTAFAHLGGLPKARLDFQLKAHPAARAKRLLRGCAFVSLYGEERARQSGERLIDESGYPRRGEYCPS